MNVLRNIKNIKHIKNSLKVRKCCSFPNLELNNLSFAEQVYYTVIFTCGLSGACIGFYEQLNQPKPTYGYTTSDKVTEIVFWTVLGGSMGVVYGAGSPILVPITILAYIGAKSKE